MYYKTYKISQSLYKNALLQESNQPFVWSFDRKKSQKGYVADIFNDQWLTMALMGGCDMDGI